MFFSCSRLMIIYVTSFFKDPKMLMELNGLSNGMWQKSEFLNAILWAYFFFFKYPHPIVEKCLDYQLYLCYRGEDFKSGNLFDVRPLTRLISAAIVRGIRMRGKVFFFF